MPASIQQQNTFTQIPDWVILHPLTHAEFHVYAAICRRTNKHRTAYPGHRRIAKEAHCSTATVGPAIDKLEKVGAIIVTRDPKTRATNDYYLPMEPFGGVAMTDTPRRDDRDQGAAMTASQLETVTTNRNKRAPDGAHQVEVTEQDGHPYTVPIDTQPTRKELHNQMIEALLSAMGWDRDEITKTMWSQLRTAAKDLLDVDVDPNSGEVGRRAMRYRGAQPGKLTPLALVKWWADCAPPNSKPCPNKCGPDGFYWPTDDARSPVACLEPGCAHKRERKP